MLIRPMTILIMSLFSIYGYSAEDCKTSSPCQEPSIGVAQQISVVARNSDGSIRRMNHDEAVPYCAGKGMHLPSAREFAQFSQSLGAAGISETPKNGYYPMSVKNADGRFDKFYFNYKGFKRPANDLWKNWFWSSSIKRNNPRFPSIFMGYNGYVGHDVREDDRVAVLCVTGTNSSKDSEDLKEQTL